MNLNDKIKVEIKTHISRESVSKFKEDINKIRIKDYLKLQDCKYILFQLFLQLGKSEGNNTLDYRTKNDIWLFIQPKIKNYVTFKTKDSLDNYIKNELNESDLYLISEVENGVIVKDF